MSSNHPDELPRAERAILVVDDEIGVQGSRHQKSFLRAAEGARLELTFESCLGPMGFDPTLAVRRLEDGTAVDLVLLDIRFGKGDDVRGYEILRLITKRFPAIPVLIMSALDRDVEALGRGLEEGAVGFIAKALPARQLRKAIDQAISVAQSHVLIGQSQAMRELRRQAARLSPYEQIPVLIVGERGTGKERVARYIHHNGARRVGPFVPVNCAALPESLLEAELFGAEKGAYTGSDGMRPGYLERANGGTLFLDEIGSMPLSAQAKLLRALQERAFRRVGVTAEEIAVTFQLVSATNEEPAKLMEGKRLREDLYDRIAAVTIRTPPLRSCREDIPGLVAHFLRELGIGSRTTLSPEAMKALENYSWPGNIRELRRVVQEAVVVSEGAAVIEVGYLPPQICGARPIAERPREEAAALSLDTSRWVRDRLIHELRMAVAAKQRIQGYKAQHWKAEFMRLMYPECRAQNAKGFQDLIRRMTKGPWGSSLLQEDPEAARLLELLRR